MTPQQQIERAELIALLKALRRGIIDALACLETDAPTCAKVHLRQAWRELDAFPQRELFINATTAKEKI